MRTSKLSQRDLFIIHK